MLVRPLDHHMDSEAKGILTCRRRFEKMLDKFLVAVGENGSGKNLYAITLEDSV